RNRQPGGLASCHMRIIPGWIGTIVPGLPGAGLRAVAGMVAVIAGAGIDAAIVTVVARAGIVAEISMLWIVAVIVGVGIAVTPPKRRVYRSDPEPPVKMSKTMVEPAIIGIGRLWLNNRGSDQQCRCGNLEGPSDGPPGSVTSSL